MTAKKVIRLAIAGNPNAGKTTLFNALTGSRQRVANYPGVTVEKKEGKRHYKDYEFIIYDLPGTYSLTAYSLDEVVTRDFILDEKPDMVIDVLDATNLERNLYLCLQFQELGVPIVAALNITDQAEKRGIHIDSLQLSQLLGIPFIKTVGPSGKGLETLLDSVIDYQVSGRKETKAVSYGPELEQEINVLSEILNRDKNFSARYPTRWLAIKLIEKDANADERILKHPFYREIKVATDAAIHRMEMHFGRDAEIVVSEQRYGYIHGTIVETVTSQFDKSTLTEMVDRILLNRFLGFPLFIFILWLSFQLTFKLGEYPTAWLEMFFGWLANTAAMIISAGPLKALVVDGVIAGVGGVFSFVPPVVLLFACLSILEDTGYMARAAFIMDKFLHLFGLHGQSVMPMMMGFGCSVPAVMAARTLKNPRDRIITVLITPFMSCGAKLPVYVLLAGAFFAPNPGNAVLAIYLIGVGLSLSSALLLRKIIFKGQKTPFVMELPPYRLPTVKGVVWHVGEKVLQYFKRAGTVILAASVLIWVVTTYPKTPIGDLKNAQSLEYSMAGRVGKFIEPAIRPIGFDWKIGVAALTGFAAKEITVSTLSILYKTEAGPKGEVESLRSALRSDPNFSPLVGFTLMLFTLIIAPCFAALSAMQAEIGWKWVGFHLVYSTLLTWCICFVVYQGGKFFF